MHRQSDMLLTLGGGRLLRCLPQRLESMVMPSVISWPLTSLLARSSRILSLPPTIVMWAVPNHMYILFVVCYCALQGTSLVLQHMHFWTVFPVLAPIGARGGAHWLPAHWHLWGWICKLLSFLSTIVSKGGSCRISALCWQWICPPLSLVCQCFVLMCVLWFAHVNHKSWMLMFFVASVTE